MGESAGNHFGESVAGAGDVNGDGYEDVIVGARDFNCGAGPVGKIYVYFGSGAGLSAANVFTEVGNGKGSMGRYVAAAGDINRDGFACDCRGAGGAGRIRRPSTSILADETA